MIKETPLIKLVNYIYIYLLLSIISWILILCSFTLLLVPVLSTNYKVIKLYEELEFDIHRQFIKSYFKIFINDFKHNIRYIPFSLYLLLSIYALNNSFLLTLFVSNLFISVVAFYIIAIILNINLNEEEKKLSIKQIYIYFVMEYTAKQKLDLFMLSLVYLLFMYFGFTRLFIAGLMIFVYVSYKILRKEKND
ncbi:hypothetical protein RZE84_06500 [Mollicutes bacterium LVI A0075]|nr:hypothetical protein RZE84_06500 [Mollicutes bacterium LVI A0075]